MKANMQVLKLVLLPLLLPVLFSCSNVRISTIPDPNKIESPKKRCGSLIIRAMPTPDNISVGGDYVEGFVNNLRKYRMFKEIYYPAWPDEKSDMQLDIKIEGERNDNPGENLARGALIGASLMLLEPFIDGEYDFMLKAYGYTKSNNGVEGEIKAQCETKLLMKTADEMGNNKKMNELLAVNNCMEALSKQLMLQLERLCP
jgi:hypothetical protein